LGVVAVVVVVVVAVLGVGDNVATVVQSFYPNDLGVKALRNNFCFGKLIKEYNLRNTKMTITLVINQINLLYNEFNRYFCYIMSFE